MHKLSFVVIAAVLLGVPTVEAQQPPARGVHQSDLNHIDEQLLRMQQRLGRECDTRSARARQAQLVGRVSNLRNRIGISRIRGDERGKSSSAKSQMANYREIYRALVEEFNQVQNVCIHNASDSSNTSSSAQDSAR